VEVFQAFLVQTTFVHCVVGYVTMWHKLDHLGHLFIVYTLFFVVFCRRGYWNRACGRGASIPERSWSSGHGSQSNQDCQGTALKPFNSEFCAKVLNVNICVQRCNVQSYFCLLSENYNHMHRHSCFGFMCLN